jgi:hypothetical protein
VARPGRATVASGKLIAVDEDDPTNLAAIRRRFLEQIGAEAVRITQHAQQEMAEEAFTYDDVVHAFTAGDIIENYLRYRNGLRRRKGEHPNEMQYRGLPGRIRNKERRASSASSWASGRH